MNKEQEEMWEKLSTTPWPGVTDAMREKAKKLLGINSEKEFREFMKRMNESVR